MSIGELLDNSIVHERIPVPVDPRLTRGAWFGLGLLLVQLLVLDVGRSATGGFPTWDVVSWAFTGFGHPAGAHTLTQAILVAGAVGAVATRGFTRATTVGHSGQLGLLAAGVAAAVSTAWILVVGAGTLAVLAVVGVLALVALAIVGALGIVLLVALTPVVLRLSWAILVGILKLLVR